MGDEKFNDEELMTRVTRGDTVAYEALYDRYSSAVMGFALKITGDRALAEEVVQETFWRVWRKADSFHAPSGSFAAWFFSIARNLAIDTLRRQRTQGRPAIQPEQIIEQVVDPAPDVAETALLRVEHQKMRAAVGTLPLDQRRVIEMAYFRGMTRQEISEATGEPLGTIHTRARLALQKLREEMQGFEE